MTVRATLRGAQQGLVDPLVVDPEVHDATAPAHLQGVAAGRATLVTRDQDGAAVRHQVLFAAAGPARTGGREVEIVVDGWRFEVEVEPEARAALREKATRDGADAGQSGPVEVRAIIPGVVVSVAVTPGDAVTAGQQLLVVEAMKMQNELRAPRAGTVGRVDVGERATIEVGDLLVVIE